jgi:hypothetical protein
VRAVSRVKLYYILRNISQRVKKPVTHRWSAHTHTHIDSHVRGARERSEQLVAKERGLTERQSVEICNAALPTSPRGCWLVVFTLSLSPPPTLARAHAHTHTHTHTHTRTTSLPSASSFLYFSVLFPYFSLPYFNRFKRKLTFSAMVSQFAKCCFFIEVATTLKADLILP